MMPVISCEATACDDLRELDIARFNMLSQRTECVVSEDLCARNVVFAGVCYIICSISMSTSVRNYSERAVVLMRV
jgi:hypothetical protein